MQIVDDEDATSDPFSMSVVGKPMNTLAPIVSSCQLFQGQSRTLLSSHIIQVSDKKQIESAAMWSLTIFAFYIGDHYNVSFISY